MAKIAWNDFINRHGGAAVGFGTVLTPSLRGKLDKNQRKLPSPFALLCDELATIIQGPWAAKKGGKRTECLFMVADAADLAAVRTRFGLGQPNPPSPNDPWTAMHLLNFRDRDYGDLARKRGFNV